MDPMEADSSGNSRTICVDDVSSTYAASYLESFLPAYHMVNQSSVSCVADRYNAIKFAADASLAVTAGGVCWSDALKKQLMEGCGGRVADDASCDDRLASSLETVGTPTTTASAFGLDKIEESEKAGLVREPSALSESDSWRMKVDGNSAEHRRGLVGRMKNSFRCVVREGRKDWRRTQRSSRNASRLAILRTLSLKSKCKRRLMRRSRNPRATLRKARSLAKGRGRPSRRPKSVGCREPERRFEDGIVALQRLVPGGTNLDAAVLLDEAADFVMFLQLQVQALKSVARAVDEQFGGIV